MVDIIRTISEIETIEDIINSVKKVEHGPLRISYENKILSKNLEPGDINLKLDKEPKIINKDHSKWEYDIKYFGDETIISKDIGENYAVAITDKTYDEHLGNDGLTYKRKIYLIDINHDGVIKEKEFTYRYGTRHKNDNFNVRYDEIKLLSEQKDKVVIGLKSNDELRIVNLSSYITLEKYDLKKELDEKNKIASLNNAINNLDKSSIKRLLESKPSNDVHDQEIISSYKDYKLASINNKDRPYDAKVEDVNLYLIIKNKGLMDLGTIYLDTHHTGASNYRIIPEFNDIIFNEIGDTLSITGNVKAVYRVYGGSSSTQDKKSFELTALIK